jgi:hypothetical protein
VFDDLNARYFKGELERPALSWSRQRTRRVFGHHDGIHRTIIISRTIDSPRVPLFALEYVLYHEMLHIKHPPRSNGSRRIYHSREFRADERRFENYDRAVEFLQQIASTVRRRRSRARRQKRKPAGKT